MTLHPFADSRHVFAAVILEPSITLESRRLYPELPNGFSDFRLTDTQLFHDQLKEGKYGEGDPGECQHDLIPEEWARDFARRSIGHLLAEQECRRFPPSHVCKRSWSTRVWP